MKQGESDDERVSRLFTSLLAQIDAGHMLNAVKTCDRILRIDAADRDALDTKIALLLHTEQYDAALALLDPARHPFQLAYALYRLHRENDALHILPAPDDRPSLHLHAQIAYRTAAYPRAVELYTRLLESAPPNSEEHTDILTNLRAAQAHHDFIATGYRAALPASVAPLLPTPLRGPVPPALHQQEHNDQPKKPSKKRVPPGVVPGVTPPPDPERWLKKSERSSVPGRRRRGGGVTQGTTAPSEPEGKPKPKQRKRK